MIEENLGGTCFTSNEKILRGLWFYVKKALQNPIIEIYIVLCVKLCK